MGISHPPNRGKCRVQYSTTNYPNQPAGAETFPASFAARCTSLTRRIRSLFCSVPGSSPPTPFALCFFPGGQNNLRPGRDETADEVKIYINLLPPVPGGFVHFMDNDFLNKLVEHRILEAVSGGPLEGTKKTGGLVSASCLFGFRVWLWVGSSLSVPT